MTDDENSRFIRKVEGLLKLAADPSASQAERETAQEKADALIYTRRLDRAKLFMKNGAAAQREVVVRKYPKADLSEFVGTMNLLRFNVFTHFDLLGKETWEGMTVVGYEEEMQLAELMWTSIFLHLNKRMFPKWEDHKSFDANVYDIKSAGYSWPQVRRMGMRKEARDQYGPLTEQNAGSKLRSAYKREAARRGVEVKPGKQQPLRPEKWRESFLSAYYNRICSRLRQMKEKNELAAGEEGVLALITEQDRVRHKFYELFPDLHPDAVRRRQEEARKAEQERWNALSEKERERIRKRDAAWMKRYRDQSQNQYDEKGWRAGVAAADEADLGTGKLGSEGETKALS